MKVVAPRPAAPWFLRTLSSYNWLTLQPNASDSNCLTVQQAQTIHSFLEGNACRPAPEQTGPCGEAREQDKNLWGSSAGEYELRVRGETRAGTIREGECVCGSVVLQLRPHDYGCTKISVHRFSGTVWVVAMPPPPEELSNWD